VRVELNYILLNRPTKTFKMADDEPTPEVEAPEEPAEEVEMSVLDALKEVS
jgi:hypothetical protein